MNGAQSRTLASLWTDIDRLHTGSGTVKVDAEDDHSLPDWVSVTVWDNGLGTCLLIDPDGGLFGDTGEEENPPARLTWITDHLDPDRMRWSWEEIDHVA